MPEIGRATNDGNYGGAARAITPLRGQPRYYVQCGRFTGWIWGTEGNLQLEDSTWPALYTARAPVERTTIVL